MDPKGHGVPVGQGARCAGPITYHDQNLSKDSRTRKEEGTMVVIEHYDLTKLSSMEAEQ
jgi:hypothetical protein